MPTDMQSNIADELPSLTNVIAKMTISQLKEKALAQLDALQTAATNFITMKSNLDILMNRHAIGKSYISKWADWYGEKSWWKQLGIGILLVVVSALIGSLFNMALVCALLAIGFCSMASFI